MNKNKPLPFLNLSSEECENLEYIQEKKRVTEGKISSKGYKKMWEYFLEISDRDDFNSDIKKLRRISSVDEAGFARKHTSGLLVKEEGYVNWLKKVGKKGMVLCMRRLDVIKKRFGFSVGVTSDPVETYFFFNTKEPPVFESTWNTCVVVNELDRRKNPLRADLRKQFDERYPISLRVSPYATLNQIKDLLNRIFSAEIEPVQRLYYKQREDPNRFKPKIYTKTTAEVRRFIYENKGSPSAELESTIKDKFGITLQYFEIDKIKLKEKNRRKK